jgi:hypothetical protein
MPGAVFLSYASQDAPVVRRIRDALQAAGLEVWFDQSELVGGDAWDAKIRGQIKACALFLPVISAATQARREGYFRIEWKLAAQRTHAIADGTPFLVPVVIDGTREPEALVPEEFRAVQWTRLPDGTATPAFCERIRRLAAADGGAPTGEPAPVSSVASVASVTGESGNETGGARRAGSRRGRWSWAALLAGISAAAVVMILVQPRWRPKAPEPSVAPVSPPGGAPPRAAASNLPVPAPGVAAAGVSGAGVTGAGPTTEARQLAVRARDAFGALDSTRDDFALAEDLLRQALAKDSTDAEVWAAQSQLNSGYLQRGFEVSDARRNEARSAAKRALRLDPRSFEARYANSQLLGFTGQEVVEREKILRELRQERPADHRVLRELAAVDARTDRLDEAAALDRESAALPGGDPLALYDLTWDYWYAGHPAEAKAALAATLAQRSFAGALLLDAFLTRNLDGNLPLARAKLARVPAWELAEDRGATVAAAIYMDSRDPDAALTALAALPRDWINDNFYRGPKALLAGDAQELAHRLQAAAIEWRTALKLVEARSSAHPDDPELLLLRAELLVRLGDPPGGAEALQAYEQMVGAHYSEQSPMPWNVVALYIRLGHRAEAIRQLRYLQALPFGRSHGFTRALLRFQPVWDPLRGDPAFERLLVEPALIAAPGSE